MNYKEEELNIDTEKETEQNKSIVKDNKETLKIMLGCLIITWLFAILFFIPFIAIVRYLGLN